MGDCKATSIAPRPSRKAAVLRKGTGLGRPAGRLRQRLTGGRRCAWWTGRERSSRGHPMTNVRTRWSRVAQVFLPVLAVMVAGCAPQAVTSQGREISDLYTIVFVV